MLLRNLQLINEQGAKDIQVDGGTITAINNYSEGAATDSLSLNFDNALAFPGLINSHEHLEFNLFPRTGNRIYNNYVEWGEDIQKTNKDTINKVLKIPEQLRAQWGLYKNLLCGITTVVNHGKNLDISSDLVTVLQNNISLHSVKLEKGWKKKLNRPFVKEKLFTIHTGEGTDKNSFEEINELIKWNLLKRKLVGIHGVAMNIEQAKHFEALIWCPETNFFLLGRTAPVKTLKHATKILFGTDSTLSSDWNIWEHLLTTRKTHELTDEELYQSLTTTAAEIWSSNGGSLEQGKDADIVVVKANKTAVSLDDFFATCPEDILLVILHGKVRLFDSILLEQMKFNNGEFSKINMNGSLKFVAGDLSGLMNQIKRYYPEANFPVSSIA